MKRRCVSLLISHPLKSLSLLESSSSSFSHLKRVNQSFFFLPSLPPSLFSFRIHWCFLPLGCLSPFVSSCNFDKTDLLSPSSYSWILCLLPFSWQVSPSFLKNGRKETASRQYFSCLPHSVSSLVEDREIKKVHGCVSDWLCLSCKTKNKKITRETRLETKCKLFQFFFPPTFPGEWRRHYWTKDSSLSSPPFILFFTFGSYWHLQ